MKKNKTQSIIANKLLFRGVYWINIILSPIYLFVMFLAVAAHDHDHGFWEILFRMLYYFLFALGSQVISLVTLVLIAKLWDVIVIKTSLNAKNITRQGLIFSVIVNAVLLTIIANIYIDNSWSFKHGNYWVVFMPAWALGLYYLICYIVGDATHKPKWLN